MAAAEYYGGHRLTMDTSSPVPHSSSVNTPTSSSDANAPPPYVHPPSGNPYDSDRPAHVSPFDSVFDDHVYPIDPRRGDAASSQLSFAQDTRYQGANHTPPLTRPYGADDIPLQNRPTQDAYYQSDHVYDAEPGVQPQATKDKKRGGLRFGEFGMLGSDKKRIPFVVYAFTIVQVIVFIVEFVRNAQETGSPIMTQPSFNPMIGPSNYVLINMGARFVPCMHEIPELTGKVKWHCPNSTTNDQADPNNRCTLGELCGFGAPATDENHNQWFRFIIPIFLHAGIVHILFNLLLQFTIGREMEKAIGSVRFFLVYMSAGIFGFVMGGNYAGSGVASTGASGALFGIIALTLLDLLYSWGERKNPGRELIIIIIEIVISLALGLLPGLDNFSHIGGFLLGTAMGISVLHSPNALRRRIGEQSTYSTVQAPSNTGTPPAFHKNPIGFFKGRKGLWWAWWLIRAGALLLVIIGFILLLQNFYVYRNTCGWCKYLSCLPINDWCEIGNLQITNTTNKRDVMQGLAEMAKLYTSGKQ